MRPIAIFSGNQLILKAKSGGPGWTRTSDQGIHFTRSFLNGADYLITHNHSIVQGAGRSSLLLRTLKFSGSLCTFQKCTSDLAQGYLQPQLLRVP